MLWNCVYNVFYDVYSSSGFVFVPRTDSVFIFRIGFWVGAFVFLLLISHIWLMFETPHNMHTMENKRRKGNIERNEIRSPVWFGNHFGGFIVWEMKARNKHQVVWKWCAFEWNIDYCRWKNIPQMPHANFQINWNNHVMTYYFQIQCHRPAFSRI